MKALITGITGFVGKHLKRELEENNYTVYGISKSAENSEYTFQCDIKDPHNVSTIIKKITPDVIFHLAGFSSVSKSFSQPDECYAINVIGTKNLFDALTAHKINAKVLIVSSFEVYGKAHHVPTDEKHPIRPLSPYGISKIEMEKTASCYNLPLIIVRASGHTGDDQPDSFALPSFKKQIANARNGEPILVGNLDIIRDFSDVKDVVKTYRLLMEKGIPGEVYNVGSGRGYNLSFILQKMIEKSGKNITIAVDPLRFRPADIPVMIADNTKVCQTTGIQFRNIFQDLIH